MKTLAILILSASALLFSGAKTIHQFAWLEGEWHNDGSPAFEVWQIQNDTVMLGGSYHNDGKEWLRDETIQFKYEAGEYWYIPTVEGQNNNQPVAFKLTSYTDTSFVAENPQHDFPKRIAYRTFKQGRLQKMIAEISGNRNGVEKKIAFSFTKGQN